MPEMSEKYLEVLLQVSGKKIEPITTNRVIGRYDEKLKNLKIEEQRSDGKIFKASVCVVDERKHELIDKNTLLLSRQIKFNIFDPYPHNANNSAHYIYVQLHRALMGIIVKEETSDYGEIVIRTIDSSQRGDYKKGKWPRDQRDRLNEAV